MHFLIFIFIIAAFVGVVIAIPYLVVKLTQLEKDKSNRWSVFWRHVSSDVSSATSIAFTPFVGLFSYIGLYQYLKSGDGASALYGVFPIVLLLIFHSNIVARKFLRFHAQNLKYLSISIFSLVLVAAGFSIWPITCFGALTVIFVLIRYVKESILVDASREHDMY